ncbi:hypothetical protein [Clostridium beijerinckii]|uniref:hypothetical protein n=1 Tax=Clostridium beijerinckii TaxID=1520 RepID=UPI001494D14B|nr:hypothetical protein [Clostridium beijerinckii]NOW03210.1 hypothetical protein [Clostridium beijerinckii]NYC03648.1 hypothetical protein [Clostridium beijerinckii]
MKGLRIMEEKYYNIEKKSLATALNWMGFKFYVWTNREGKTLYGFEDTIKLHKALNGLLELRKQVKSL